MPKHTLLKAVTPSLSLALNSTSILAAPVNSNMNWKLGVGINIDNITKSDSTYTTRDSEYFNSSTQGTSKPGFTLAAVKPITQNISFRADYVSVGTVTQKDKQNANASVIESSNQYVNLLGQYIYPINNRLDMVGTAGVTYNINKLTPNSVAVLEGADINSMSSFGITYGAGVQYHTGAATISLVDMLPRQTEGYLSLDFLYQL